MTYDEQLVARIRRVVPPTAALAERKMFGGVAFLVGGKMVVGVTGTDLMVRVGPAAYEAALARAHVRPMDFTGRPLTGYVYVGAKGTRTAAAVAGWVAQAMRFVATLSPAAPRRACRTPRAPRRRRG